MLMFSMSVVLLLRAIGDFKTVSIVESKRTHRLIPLCVGLGGHLQLSNRLESYTNMLGKPSGEGAVRRSSGPAMNSDQWHAGLDKVALSVEALLNQLSCSAVINSL